MFADSNYILRRYDKAPHLPFTIGAYREQVKSVAFTVDGVEACTLFIREKSTRDLAVQSGWKDETEKVKSFFLYKKQKEEKKDTPKRGRPKKSK